jgi:hypothetical protein
VGSSTSATFDAADLSDIRAQLECGAWYALFVSGSDQPTVPEFLDKAGHLRTQANGPSAIASKLTHAADHAMRDTCKLKRNTPAMPLSMFALGIQPPALEVGKKRMPVTGGLCPPASVVVSVNRSPALPTTCCRRGSFCRRRSFCRRGRRRRRRYFYDRPAFRRCFCDLQWWPRYYPAPPVTVPRHG